MPRYFDGRPIRVSEKSVEDIYIAEMEMDFDDTRAARIHRKEELASVKENTARQFPAGQNIFVIDTANPFSEHVGTVLEVTRAGKIKALLALFGRFTPVEFDIGQLRAV